MYSLLLDSSNIKLGIGLAKDGKLIDQICYDAWQRQSEYMIQEIENILKRNNISTDDINEIISTVGPGSYTGVRISLTIAKVWCEAKNIPLYLVSSLEILKDYNSLSLCVINARSKRSYCAIYDGDKTILEDQILSNDEVNNLLEAKKAKICGETEYLGYEGYQSNIFENMLLIRNKTQKVEDILSVKPIYLKD